MEQLLVFSLAEELYGLEVDQIQEVVEAPVLHYIPRAPKLLLGAINFHGAVLPVLDLGGYLGLEAERRDQRVIVLAGKSSPMALATTRVKGFIPLEIDALLPLQEERREKTFIRAVQNRGGEMINLLDLDRLLAGMDRLFEETGGDRGA